MGILDSTQAIYSGTQSAATQAMTSDPLMQKLQAAQDQKAAINAATAKTVEANMDERKQIMAEPLPPMPKAPVLEKIAPAPTQPPKSPLKVMAQMLPLIAAIGSAKTQTSAAAALNAGASALNAIHEGDVEKAKQARQEWLDHMQVTLANNQITSQEYMNLINDRKMSWEDKQARLSTLAAANQDAIMLASLRSPDISSITNLIDMRDKTAKQLQDIYQHAQEQQLAEARLAEEQRHNRVGEGMEGARLANDRERLGFERQRTENDTNSPTNVQGRILAHLAAGKTLTAGEQAAWDKAMQRSEAQSGISGLLGGGLAAGGGGPTSPALAPNTPALAAARSGGGGGQPKPAPANPGARVANTVYSTPRGALRWTGTGWVQP